MNLMELFASLGLEVDEKSFEHGQELIEGVHHALEAFAIFEGAKWIKEMFDQTEEGAIQVSHLSQRLGIASDDLQKLTYAAQANGASQETFTAGMMHMSAGLEEARKKGTGPFVEGIRKLGLSMSDPTLKSGNLADVTNRVADGFADAGPQVNKTAAAMEIVGRHGTELIPMFNKGADGIKEFGDELEELGGVTSEETIKAFEELEATQSRLKVGWHALVTNAVTALLPQIKDLTESLLKWVKANKDLIKQRIEQVFAAIVWILGKLATVFGWVMDAVAFVNDHLQFFVILLGEALVAIAVLKAGTIAASIKMMWAWIRAFAPLLLVVGILVLIGLAIDDVMNYLNGGDSAIGDFIGQFEGGWDRIKAGGMAALEAVLDFFLSIPGKVWDGFIWLLKLVGKGWLEIGKLAWDGIKDILEALWDGFTGGLSAIGDLFIGIFKVVFGWIVDKLDWVWDKIKAAGSAVKDFFTGDMTSRVVEMARAANSTGAGAGAHAAELLAGAAPAGAGPTDTWAGPQATAPSSMFMPQMQSQITIQIPPGARPEEYARVVANAFETLWGDKIRQFAGASGAKAAP